MKARLCKKIKDFDVNYDFIKGCFFDHKLIGPDQVSEISAKKWIRELFFNV